MAGVFQEQVTTHLFSTNPITVPKPGGGFYQYMAGWGLGGTTGFVWRIERGVQRWGPGGGYTQHEFSTAEKAELGIPIDIDDDHLMITPCPDADGYIWVAGGMHGQNVNPVRVLRSANPHDMASEFIVPSDPFPSISPKVTYPIFTPLGPLGEDGLLYYCRDAPVTHGGTGMANGSLWRKLPGDTTWRARQQFLRGVPLSGPGSETNSADDDNEFNWSPYTTVFYVQGPDEPEPGVIDVWIIWRRLDTGGDLSQAEIDRTNDFLSFVRSYDNGVTWKTIHGDTVTLPMEAWVDQGQRTGLTCPTGLAGQPVDGYANFGGCCVDDDGHPHCVLSVQRTHHAWWTGSAWTQTPIGFGTGNFQHLSRKNCLWIDGKLHMIATSQRTSGALANVRSTYLFTDDGTRIIRMGGQVGNPNGEWEIGYDKGAWQRWKRVECMYLRGNVPMVYSFPNKAQVGGAS